MKRCRAGIDDARVLSANRQALVLECILIDTVHTHTHKYTLYPQVSLFTFSVGYHHYPHIYKYQTYSFFSQLPSSFLSFHLCLHFSGSPAQLSPD